MTNACLEHYRKFHTESIALLDECEKAGSLPQLSAAHAKVDDLYVWATVIEGTEVEILRAAFKEYEFALLCLTQGFYRQSFFALRLFLEMALHAVQLSTNEVDKRLWFAGEKDVTWQSIAGGEKDDVGIFASSFVQVFCPEAEVDAKHMKSICRKLYRECSEFVHGNYANNQKLPQKQEFSKELFETFIEKAANATFAVNFTLMIRYYKDLNKEKRTLLEPILTQELLHTSCYQILSKG